MTPRKIRKQKGGDDKSLEQIIDIFIQNTDNVNIKNNHNDTPIYIAARWGHFNIVDALLKKGADPNIQNNSGHTPILLAANEEHKKVVELLINNGSDPNIKDNVNAVPIQLTAFWNWPDTTKLLLEKGADPNIQHQDGTTALIYGVEASPDVVKVLLDYNANPNLKDNDGNSALLIACQEEHPEIVKLLLNKGAIIDDSIKSKISTFKPAIKRILIDAQKVYPVLTLPIGTTNIISLEPIKNGEIIANIPQGTNGSYMSNFVQSSKSMITKDSYNMIPLPKKNPLTRQTIKNPKFYKAQIPSGGKRKTRKTRK